MNVEAEKGNGLFITDKTWNVLEITVKAPLGKIIIS